MLISIVIPTLNRAHLISETLDSILAQTYTNWECIIVDDGSTDETEKVVREYIKKDNRFQYHLRPYSYKRGGNGARNYGFSLSKGQYIKWFDSDDVMLSDCLEKQVALLKDYDVSICQVMKYDFENQKSLGVTCINSNLLIQDYLVGKVTFYISGPLWKKCFLNKQKKIFDEAISNLDDWDFNLRMLYQDPVVVFINEALIQYRVHETSLSHEINNLNFEEIQSEFKAIRKHLIIIKQNKKADSKMFEIYLKNRCQFILRAALVENNEHKFYYLKQVLILEFKLFQYIEMIKTVIGYIVYSIFKKGYRLL